MITEPLGYPTVGGDILNSGVGGAKTVKPSVQTLSFADVDFEVQETDLGASAYKSLEAQIPLAGQWVNYLSLECSGRGNPVHVCIGSSIRWVVHNGIAYPISDFRSGGIGAPSGIIPLPPSINRTLYVVINPPAAAAGYTDTCRISYGYRPDLDPFDIEAAE